MNTSVLVPAHCVINNNEYFHDPSSFPVLPAGPANFPSEWHVAVRRRGLQWQICAGIPGLGELR
ncbi:hypothetical protein B7760_05871 (plasmid) [Burkholderia glumae]|nr:hypothetical protein B7760_05871 [Burkholderia glumae]